MSGRNVVKIYQTKEVISSCSLDVCVELILVLDQKLRDGKVDAPSAAFGFLAFSRGEQAVAIGADC
jgi:hypothetical protein